MDLRSERVIIPKGYKDHKIVLQVRDPWVLYAYWELNPEIVHRKTEQLRQRNIAIEKWILRLYQQSPRTHREYQDIELKGMANNWYLHVEHDHNYYVEIGLIASVHSFHPLATSNKVKTPRFGMSPIVDEQWRCLGEEYWRFFALSGGFGVGTSSFETKDIFLQRMAHWMTT